MRFYLFTHNTTESGTIVELLTRLCSFLLLCHYSKVGHIMSEIQEKEYIVDDKALMDEWDWGKNNSLGIDPRKISRGS